MNRSDAAPGVHVSVSYREGDRFVWATPGFHAPYWVPKHRGITHLAKSVRVLWRAAHASYERPRIVVDLWCRQLPPHDASAGLMLRAPAPLCERCLLKRELRLTA